MGRNRKPIEDLGPVGQFAQALRDRMDTIVPPSTFRKIGRASAYSHSTLSEAAAGRKFPTWQATRAFLIGCGAQDPEIKAWRRQWELTHATLFGGSRDPGDVTTVWSAASSHVAKPGLSEPERWWPRPGDVHTFDGLVSELRRMKIAIGNPGLRVLSRRMIGYCSTSTLSGIFTGKRPPSLDVTLRLVNAMLDEADAAHRLADTTDGDAWTSVNAWRAAWNRAVFNQHRRDNNHRFHRQDNADDTIETGPTARIVGELNADTAAAMLAGMTPQVAGSILTTLPIEKAQDILTAMDRLHYE